MFSDHRIHSFSTFLVVFLLFGMLPNICAQNLSSIEKRAVKSYNKGNMIQARDQFKILYDSGFLSESTTSYLAKCYIELYESSKAKKILSELSELNEENTYLLALSSLLTEDFNKADSLLKLVNDTSAFDLKEAREILAKAKKSYRDSKGYFVQNLGERINTKDREYSAIMYNDYNELLFTKRGEYGEDVDRDGLAYEKIYSTRTDSTNNGEWQDAQLLPMDGNNEDSHNATIQVYRSGTRMMSYKDGELYSHKLENGVWQSQGDLFLAGLNGNNTHCFISDDENTLLLASDFMDGQQLDLFIFRKDSTGKWSVPQPIKELNTKFDEDSPFLSKNGTLYFSSRGHNSMGGFDIFQSTYDTLNQKWREPENLGHPINTVAEDTYFNMDGKVGYLSSTREGGFGSLDIYRVFFFNKVSVAGQLLDSANNPISNAQVNINYDSSSLKTYTDENGAYELLVPIYKEMKLTFEKDSAQLHKGSYIAHVFFKDQNDNSYNLYFENTEDPEINLTNSSSSKVKHINIKVKNDYSENLILGTVPQKEEMAWADSINTIDSVMYVNKLSNKEEAVRFIKETTSVSSENLQINDVVIIKKVEDTKDNVFEEIKKEKSEEAEIDDKLYTVQLLALTIPNKPLPNYFDQLKNQSVVFNAQGADGLNRFYTGSYETKRQASRARKELQEMGYQDAFVRKIKLYKEL